MSLLALTRPLSLLALCCATALAGSPAFARNDDAPGQQKKRGEGGTHRHQEQAQRSGRDGPAAFNDSHRDAARRYYSQHYPAGRKCPPGLAKKNNGCLPPGQAKKYAVGQPLPREVVYYPVPQPVIVQLPPPPPAHRYVRVGVDILLISPRNRVVVNVLAGVLG